MKYCRKCGSPNPSDARTCEACAHAFETTPLGFVGAVGPGLKPEDKRWIFLGNLCLSPILGVILYLVWKDGQRAKADQVCTLTWWAVAIWGVLFVLFVLASIAAART